MTQKLEDSGERRQFSTGAVRDRGGLKPRPDLISPHAQMREGMIHTLGSEKYDLRNWEQGMPISECLASAQRHIEQYKRGDTNEDHIAQARWNLGAIIHFEEEIKAGRMDPTLDDMPKYAQQPPGIDATKDVIHRSDDMGDITPTPTTVEDTGGIKLCPRCHTRLDTAYYVDTGRDESSCHLCGWTSLDAPFEPPTYYIAGPMRGCKNLNFEAFDAAKERGERLGFSIISPADLDREHGIDPTTDPAVMEQESHLSASNLHRIIRRDLEAIMALQPERGDGIAVLNNWEDSTGATAEVALAQWLGLKVVWASDFRTHAIERRE